LNIVHKKIELIAMVKQGDRYAALRTRLIDVAERTISERGLGAMKARDLAAEAGCAIGTIYNVFAHMDELILCVSSRTLAMLYAALGAAQSTHPYASPEEAVDALVRLALAYLDFAARQGVRWRALFEHRLSDGHSLPEWYVEQQHLLFAQVEGPLAALLPDLDDDRRRVLARTLFSAVHGVVALGLEEKLISLPLPDLRDQVAAVVRAITSGRDELRGGNAIRA
jgi:AcrR family transcriptional regulator